MATDFFGNFSWYQFPEGLVSFESLWYINTIVSFSLTTIVSFFGVIFNVVNIIVFLKQHARDSSSIALLGLAISDAGASLSLLFWSQQYNPLVTTYRGSIDLLSILSLVTLWPHVLFTRTTCWITAYITIERYLCVAMPLKVKIILNAKRTTWFIILIFLTMIFSIIPIYSVNSIGNVYISIWNISIVSVTLSSNWQVIQKGVVSFNAAVELTAFLATIVFTFALVQKFVAKTRWRREKSNISDSFGISTRDKKFIQTVILISVTFIISYIPSVLATITLVVFKELSVLFVTDFSDVLWKFAFFLESVNFTVTIFIYLSMSSRYKAVFCDILRRCLHLQFVKAQATKSEIKS